MAVYVDGAENGLGRMKMCHMIADTEEELHEMADALGMKRGWFQWNASFPHYDVAKGKRAKAVELGAVELDRRGMGAKMKELKQLWSENHTWQAILANGRNGYYK